MAILTHNAGQQGWVGQEVMEREGKEGGGIIIMLYNRYKLQSNNGLLPKIDPSRITSPKPSLPTYCLLNRSATQQYTLERSALEPSMLVMFNQKEYLHRKCSLITESAQPAKIVEQIADTFGKGDHTLTIFVANDPTQSDTLILGPTSAVSLMSQAYQQLRERKESENTIKLSIMGIESENSLTDELNFEWLDQQSLTREGEEGGLKAIVAHKQKVKVLKHQYHQTHHTQGLSSHEVHSQEKLQQLLKRYRDTKAHFENWVLSTQHMEYYLLGEVYQLAEVSKEGQTSRSHYILRVNQYIRTTSPLMLKLGINLRRIEEDSSHLQQMHQTKLFKLLSECFSNRQAKKYDYHLFLQVGHYDTLKEEYLCLVPTSPSPPHSLSFEYSPFFYTKQAMEYPLLQKSIKALLPNRPFFREDATLPQIPRLVKERLKTRSYICETYSSQEKKIGRAHLATQENDRSHLDLEDLVLEAAKVYRIPSPKPLPKGTSDQLRKLPKYSKINLFRREEVPSTEETGFQKRREESQQQSKQTSKKKMEKSSFYENTKVWLDQVYGKRSRHKLEHLNRRVKRFDETTKILVEEMLNQETNYPEQQQHSEVLHPHPHPHPLP